MPANEFEKQVQQIMGDLKLSPSSPVWLSIEKQIRKKKERRRLLFLLLLFFIFISGSLWIYLGNNKGTQVSENKTGNEQGINNKSLQTVTTIPADNNKNTTTVDIHAIKKERMIKKPVDVSHVEVQSAKLKEKKNKIKSENILVKYAEKKDLDAEQLRQDKQQNITQVSKNGQEQVSILKDSMTVTSPIISEQTIAILKDTVVSEPLADKNPNAAKKKSKNKKWQKAITAEVGWSNYGDGLFNNNANYRSYSSSSPATGSGQVPGFYYDLPKISRGPSYSAGMEVKRSMGKRTSLNFGIQYHYYSTHVKVGDDVQKDTVVRYGADLRSVSSFYRDNDKRKYTNRFYVLEIPVSIEYKLLKNIPLSFSVGASYGHLLGTNALTFDQQSNIYYRNRKDYISNYINIFSSVQYKWLQKGKIKIQSGPAFQYSLTELQKENYFSIPHLYFIGLKSSISF